MLVIWRGYGFMVPVVFIFFVIVLKLLEENLFGPAFKPYFHYGMAAVAVCSAATVWFVGRHYNGAAPRELVDPKTGQTVLLRQKHSLFFIPMEYWAIALVALAVVFARDTHFGERAAQPGAQPDVHASGSAAG